MNFKQTTSSLYLIPLIAALTIVHAAPVNKFNQSVTTVNPNLQTSLGSFELAAQPTVTFRAGPLITIFAADKGTVTLPANGNCPNGEIFKEKPILVAPGMATQGPRYTCTYQDSLFVYITENKIPSYKCQALSVKTGCMRWALWWSVWLKWSGTLSSFGMVTDDIRLNRKVTLSAKQYANFLRLFWKVFHGGNLPVETTTVHSLHGHSFPKKPLTVPKVSRGGGGFGGPIWHGNNDPCIKDTLDILFHGANKIPRPCTPITYADTSGFYVSNPDRLSSTVLGPDCNHDCGFRYYYGNKNRGQIIAFLTSSKKLKTKEKIEGAILDHF